MSRYTGPRVKKMRALDVDLPGLSRKQIWERPYPPGQHGPNNARRRKMSDYKRQLFEKQKLRFNYGVGERQFRRMFRDARRLEGSPGDNLLILLERRLDNAVFRAGFAPTIPAARQLVNHGHFLINGKKVDIPSYRLKQGETIELRERSKELQTVAESLAKPSLERPEWLSYDEAAKKATIAALPTPDSVPFPIDVQLVIEWYSKLM